MAETTSPVAASVSVEAVVYDNHSWGTLRSTISTPDQILYTCDVRVTIL